jgi:hypothetical protein
VVLPEDQCGEVLEAGELPRKLPGEVVLREAEHLEAGALGEVDGDGAGELVKPGADDPQPLERGDGCRDRPREVVAVDFELLERGEVADGGRDVAE